MRRRRVASSTGTRAVATVVATVAALALAGCSQIAAIAPVGGSRLAEVRFAAGDVLVQEGVGLLVAPVCAQAPDSSIECRGESVDGDEIVVSAPAGEVDAMEVTVSGSTLYAGSIMDVLETAMEPGR